MQITGDVKIASAFVKARHEIGGTVTKDTKGARGKYASLAAITEATAEIMGNHGLALVQECFADEAGVTVYTTLVHESGATMEFAPLSLPVEKRDAQSVGSAITYARRYQLSAICGLAPEDDDGESATKSPGNGRASAGSINTGYGPCRSCGAPSGKIHTPKCTATEAPAPTPAKPTEPAPTIASLGDVEGMALDTATDEFDAITGPAKGQTASAHTAQQAAAPAKMGDKTRKHFHAVGTKLYGDEWEEKRYEIVKAITKGAAESSNDLTEAQAKTLISGMEKRIAEAAAKEADPAVEPQNDMPF